VEKVVLGKKELTEEELKASGNSQILALFFRKNMRPSSKKVCKRKLVVQVGTFADLHCS
jgi:hypothetical protein